MNRRYGPITYTRCGHVKAASFGPPRTVDERCPSCLWNAGKRSLKGRLDRSPRPEPPKDNGWRIKKGRRP